MKLAAKFARQETENARLARIGRRRISKDREEAVRRMLSLPDEVEQPATIQCPDCARAFKLPVHLTRHRKARHPSEPA